MKKLIVILSICVSSFVWAHGGTGPNAAKEWLHIIDAGKYAESWNKADAFFKVQLTQDKWKDALNGVRAPLGKVISRSELSSKHHSSLPGAPDGEYLVIQYQTEFQNKKTSIETLTLSKSSGHWLAVGYFIK
ncbi:DUF4019 domain-containing protein [uncultured Shewanella sp.]|uniref:DUF4019 domain-containing protein n=1 Tax=Shewanella atlantica TaxID=271099 RepID=UPI002630DB6A|nr:DUF4019 domain-containing protein [uncultured Shewanella sp.]